MALFGFNSGLLCALCVSVVPFFRTVVVLAAYRGYVRRREAFGAEAQQAGLLASIASAKKGRKAGYRGALIAVLSLGG
jgi:hypothetical protein